MSKIKTIPEKIVHALEEVIDRDRSITVKLFAVLYDSVGLNITRPLSDLVRDYKNTYGDQSMRIYQTDHSFLDVRSELIWGADEESPLIQLYIDQSVFCGIPFGVDTKFLDELQKTPIWINHRNKRLENISNFEIYHWKPTITKLKDYALFEEDLIEIFNELAGF